MREKIYRKSATNYAPTALPLDRRPGSHQQTKTLLRKGSENELGVQDHSTSTRAENLAEADEIFPRCYYWPRQEPDCPCLSCQTRAFHNYQARLEQGNGNGSNSNGNSGARDTNDGVKRFGSKTTKMRIESGKTGAMDKDSQGRSEQIYYHRMRQSLVCPLGSRFSF